MAPSRNVFRPADVIRYHLLLPLKWHTWVWQISAHRSTGVCPWMSPRRAVCGVGQTGQYSHRIGASQVATWPVLWCDIPKTLKLRHCEQKLLNLLKRRKSASFCTVASRRRLPRPWQWSNTCASWRAVRGWKRGGCKMLSDAKKCVNTRSRLRWKRGAKFYRWNTRGQKSAAQTWQQLVKYGGKEQRLSQREQETQEWKSDPWGRVGLKVTLLHASVQQRNARPRRKTGKLQLIPSVGPPSNKMGWIHSGASFYNNNRRLLSLLWIVILFYRFYSVKHLRLIKKGGMFMSAWNKFHLNPNWFLPTLRE